MKPLRHVLGKTVVKESKYTNFSRAEKIAANWRRKYPRCMVRRDGSKRGHRVRVYAAPPVSPVDQFYLELLNRWIDDAEMMSQRHPNRSLVARAAYQRLADNLRKLVP